MIMEVIEILKFFLSKMISEVNLSRPSKFSYKWNCTKLLTNSQIVYNNIIR